MALSLYLLVQHTRLKNGIQGGDSFCSFASWANCAAVNGSQYSEVAGIPLATLGWLFYSVLLVLSLTASPKSKGFARVQRWAAWLAAAGLIADVALFLVQISAVKSLCIVCFSTYLATFAYLACTAVMTGKDLGLGERIKLLFGKGTKAGPKVSSQRLAFATFGWLCLATVILIVPGTVISKSAGPNGDTAEQIADYWSKLPTEEIPIKSADGALGNPAAKIKIVEFSDFECPFCQRAAGILHQTLEPLKERVYFVFKNFPLDNACNPELQHPMHVNSCKLAQLAYCAKEKGKFWDYHNLVFSLEEKTLQGNIQGLQKPLAGIFSSEEFKACLESTSARQNVQEDIQLGLKLHINATPSLFIDGKKMILPLTEENILTLVGVEEKLPAGSQPAKAD